MTATTAHRGLAKPRPDTVTLADAIEAWQRSMRSADKSAKTVAVYTYAVAKLADSVGADRALDQITRRDHEALFDALKTAGLAPASRSTVYRALRSFWKFVVEHDDLPVVKDPMNGLQGPSLTVKVVEFPSDSDVRAVLATCRPRSRHAYRAHRDEAIIRILASTGARLSEVAGLRLEDVDLPGQAIRVLGKGRRERWLPLDEATLVALKRYLDRERPRSPFADATDHVWIGPAGPMTPSGISQAYVARARAAGITTAQNVHALRHRWIATALGGGMSEGDVMSISGHRTRAMLDRYGAHTRSARAHESFRRLSASGAIPKL